jgi:hypothetical protein
VRFIVLLGWALAKGLVPVAEQQGMFIAYAKRVDVALGKPDRDLDRDRDAVVGEHEMLERLVPQLVVADGWDDECRRLHRRIAF